MGSNSDIVQKLWSLSSILRDVLMVYHQYMSELTYLLFLKIAAETGAERALPAGFRWKDLVAHVGEGQLSFYRKMLTHLGEDAANDQVRQIFAFPTTVFKHEANLRIIVDHINRIDWYSDRQDGFGDIYEGLLEKNAAESKAGAGQYFTPRPLVDSIARVVKPDANDIIQDPAAGTGGFLVSADRFIRREGNTRGTHRGARYQGCEIVQDTHRLCLMNLFVHDMDAKVIHGDALSDDYQQLDPADVIVTNPPSVPARVVGHRDELTSPIPHRTNNFFFCSRFTADCESEGAPRSSSPTTCFSKGTWLSDFDQTCCAVWTFIRF